MTYLKAEPRILTLGEASFEVLPMPKSRSDQNNRSVALWVRYGDFSVFLSGDSERPQLNFMTKGGMAPDVTVLKAPHGGAETGFHAGFLDDARPEVIVVSVGRDNPYDHPSPSAMVAYEAAADTVLRTDQHGAVTVLGYRSGAYEVERRRASRAARRPGRSAVAHQAHGRRPAPAGSAGQRDPGGGSAP